MSVPTKPCPSCSTGPMWAAARSWMPAASRETWLCRRIRLRSRSGSGSMRPLQGTTGRYHDQGTVAAVFAEAVRPRDTGAVESLMQDLVELLVQVETNVIVAVRAGESGDVHREQEYIPARQPEGRASWPMGGSRQARAGDDAARARHLVIRPEADQVFFASDRGEMPTGKVRPPASVQFVMRIAARRSSARSAASAPGSLIPGSCGRGSRWVIAEESLAPNGRKTVVSYTLRLLPGGGEGGPSVVSWRSVPPVGHEAPGRSSGFRLLGCRAGPSYWRVISPSPVMQVFAAHALSRASEESTATASAGNSRQISLESPVRVPPGRPPRKRPVQDRVSAGWPTRRRAGRRA